MTDVSASGTVRTFRITSLLRMMTPGIGVCVLTVVILFVVLRPSERIFILPVAALLVLAMALAAWLSTRTRLVISPEGIAYYGIGYRVRSSWENVEGYAKRVMGVNSVECLILRQPGIELDRWLDLGYKALPVAQGAALATGQAVPRNHLNRYEDAIPVSLFAEDWRSSEIGVLVKRYAPQAFDNPIMTSMPTQFTPSS